jgi:hypothetical protein
MGARQSSSSEQPSEPRIIFIYNTPFKTNVQISINLKDMSQQLTWITTNIKRDADKHNVTVAVDLGDDYIMDATFRATFMNPRYASIFSGIYVEQLTIDGAFSGIYEGQDRIEWWHSMPPIFLHLGIVFRDNSSITIKPLGIQHATRRDEGISRLLVFESFQ